MFDVSFSELMLIGVIAMIVIGPQRLPKVARTVGHLLGRAQRYVNDVKSDIQREVNLEEVNKVKSQMEEAARSVKSTVNDLGSTLTKPVDEAKKALDDAKSSVTGLGDTLTKPVEEARQALNEAKSSFESLDLNAGANPAAPPAQKAADTQADAEPQSANLPLPGLEPEAAPADAASKPAGNIDTDNKTTGTSS